jgi:PAS domain S-box-containing protein
MVACQGSDKNKNIHYSKKMSSLVTRQQKHSKTIVLFAISDKKEQNIFKMQVEAEKLPYTLLFPESISNVEELLGAYDVDIIITDMKFQNGGFADWLILWPQPFILIFDLSESHLADEMVTNETSDFVVRDHEGLYFTLMPHRIRKILNYKESRDRHNIHLQATERRYLDLVQALPDIIYSLDENGMFNFINNSVRSIGYEPYELLGKHFTSILHPEEIEKVSREKVLPGYAGKSTGEAQAPKLFDERRTGDRKTSGLEVRIKKGPSKNEAEELLFGSITAYGEVSAVGFSAAAIDGDFGSVGIVRDISMRKKHEELLEKSLKEKEVLLKEIHHRVKNNLQVISSLLSLQSTYFENKNDYKLYLDTQMQVQSMALVHEQLYQSDDLSRIEMTSYLNQLCDALLEIYQSDHHIEYRVEAADVYLRPEVATPLALLTAELISNSLKHAFPLDTKGMIEVLLEEREPLHYTLTVKDNGTGIQEEGKTKGLGLILIENLAEQLRGKLKQLPPPGTGFRVDFTTSLEQPSPFR